MNKRSGAAYNISSSFPSLAEDWMGAHKMSGNPRKKFPEKCDVWYAWLNLRWVSHFPAAPHRLWVISLCTRSWRPDFRCTQKSHWTHCCHRLPDTFILYTIITDAVSENPRSSIRGTGGTTHHQAFPEKRIKAASPYQHAPVWEQLPWQWQPITTLVDRVLQEQLIRATMLVETGSKGKGSTGRQGWKPLFGLKFQSSWGTIRTWSGWWPPSTGRRPTSTGSGRRLRWEGGISYEEILEMFKSCIYFVLFIDVNKIICHFHHESFMYRFLTLPILPYQYQVLLLLVILGVPSIFSQ